MIRKNILIFSFLISIFLTVGLVEGTDYYVTITGNDTTGDGSIGNPWKTIQHAVDTVSTGSIIHVAEGTYTENVVITTAVRIIGEGRDVVTVNATDPTVDVFRLRSDHIAISGVTVTGATGITTSHTGACGIYLYMKNNLNITNNRIISNDHGICGLLSHNSRITNNIITSNAYCGINLFGSNYVTIINNTINSSGVALSLIDALTNIPISDNTLTNNFNAIIDNVDGNNYTNNTLSNTNNIMFDPNLNRNVICGQDIDFSVSVNRYNGTPCSNIILNSVSINPSEDYTYNITGNQINVNFTPSRQGIYSLYLNVTDDMDNVIEQRFYFGNQSIISYYFRPDVWPTHGQPARVDSTALLFDPPDAESEFSCGSWIQTSPDAISTDITGISRIININASFWYTCGTFRPPIIGMERHARPDNGIEYGKYIPPTASYTWITKNFDVGYWLYNKTEWYWLSLKLRAPQPHIKTYPAGCSEAPNCSSYVNITYLHSATPLIRSISNNDILLLSATSPVDNTKLATLVLDGTGTTNLIVQMPNTTITYTAKYDGTYCNNSNCNFTQSNGELNFTLTVGSIHTLGITGRGIGCLIDKGKDTYSLQLDGSGNTLYGYINNTKINASISTPTEWNHYVMTYDGSTQKIYINGILETSQALSGTIPTNAKDLRIGDLFEGTIDDVKIYNRSLSANEISKEYEAGRMKYIIIETLADTHDINTTLYGQSNLTALDVWEYTTRELTGIDFNTFSNWPTLQGHVWNTSTRNLTDYNQSNLHSKLDRILTATEVRQARVNDTSTSSTKFETNLSETSNDFWDRGAVLFTSGNNKGQIRAIKKYTGSTKEVTLTTPLDSAPANGDLFVIVMARKFLLPDTDYEDISKYVWNHTTRNLTDYNLTRVLTYLGNINDTTGGAANLTASEVWTYSNRTLTDYNHTLCNNYLDTINVTVGWIERTCC